MGRIATYIIRAVQLLTSIIILLASLDLLNHSLYILHPQAQENYPKAPPILIAIAAFGGTGILLSIISFILPSLPRLHKHIAIAITDTFLALSFLSTSIALIAKLGLRSRVDLEFTTHNDIINGGTVFVKDDKGKMVMKGYEEKETYGQRCYAAHGVNMFMFLGFVLFTITVVFAVTAALERKVTRIGDDRKSNEV